MKVAVFVVAVVLVLVLVLVRILRSSSQSRGGSPAAPKQVTGRKSVGAQAGARTAGGYRAISVKCGPDACAQALALGKRRFLPGQLRTLPLPDCTSADCQCKFVHHPDRRDSDGDQRALSSLSSQLYSTSGKPERRSRAGRRKKDFE